MEFVAGIAFASIVGGSISSIIFNTAYYTIYYSSKGLYSGISYVLSRSPDPSTTLDINDNNFVVVYNQ